MNLTPAFRELHRIHRQLDDVRSRIARGPKQIAAAEVAFKKFEAELAKAKDNHKQAKLASDEKQLQLKSREAKILEVRAKLHQAESNQVYQMLKDQIAADEKANSVLTDEILESLEQLESLQSKIGEANVNLLKGKDELEKTRKRVAETQAELETELARVLAELSIAEQQLPEDFRAEFLRLSKAKGEDAMASVEGETCGGCYQTLVPQTMNELYMGKPVFCKSCGRLLYLATDRQR
jgi:predicted  nucleic acid-binding Zn-ribbon protein